MASMLTGDRRWTPARKSSMIVLGKVPKPINLPSQRSENHGLDPNVEIVPKGTITWGSQPSSTNAWGSSAMLSPKEDGSSGRPSSGGSGTRPSTACGDRFHEPALNVWGPNSRPSSASGALASNQTSTFATRPRSAETRPSSSQLSRFAESPVENTVPWGVSGTTDKGAATTKTNHFSLSSGDFPTLGSDKNSESQVERGHSSHGCPGSASGSAAAQKEASRPLSSGNGNVNSWKAVDYPPFGGGPQPHMSWQHDLNQAQLYPAANIPTQPFGPWNNPQFYPSDPVWYSGGAVGGQYRPASPPGSYPVDPYAYCPPQFPFRPPGGYNHKNVESYHNHQPPDAHMVPSHYPAIPVRPGVNPYSGPYDGHYGPPHTNFSNSNEREVSVMGMPNSSPVYDPHSSQNANVRPSVNISLMAKEQKESQQPHETRTGQYKILLKPHDGREKNGAQDKREQSMVSNPPHLDRGNVPEATVCEEAWQRNRRNDERALVVESVPCKEAAALPANDCKDSGSDPVVTILLESPTIIESASSPICDHQQHPILKKKASLIEKIEGLNSKARITDGHGGQKEKMKHYKVVNLTDHSVKVLSTDVISATTAPTFGTATSVSDKLDVSTEDVNQKSHNEEKFIMRPVLNKPDSMEVGEKANSQVHRRAQVTLGRVDEHARSNNRDDDGSMKNSLGRDSISAGFRLLDCHPSQGSTEGLHHAADSADPSYAPSSLDSTDCKAERAKLKERAMLRAKELQQQEEKRIREQKAKAFAKLEELNKRSSAQSSNQKTHDMPPKNDVEPKESTTGAVFTADAMTIEAPSQLPAQGSESLMQASECEIKNPTGVSDSFVGVDPQVTISGQESSSAEATYTTNADLHDNSVTKRKQTGSRRRSNTSLEKSQSDNPKSAEVLRSPDNIDVVSTDVLPGIMETAVPQRKKFSRNSRNKSKPVETIVKSTVPSTAASEDLQPQTDGDNNEILASLAESTVVSAQSSSESPVQGQPQPMEKMHDRVSNQWRLHSFTKPTRNQKATRHANKFHGSEAVVWAPVKPFNKNEPSVGLSERSNSGTSSHSSGKNGNDSQHVMKTKRAEIERYVPKPVVEEMSQQDSCQEPSSSLNQTAGNMVEKPNRHGRNRGSWRQRGSAEMPLALQGSNVGGLPSDHPKPVMEPSDQNQPPPVQQQFQSDGWGSSNDNPLSAVQKFDGFSYASDAKGFQSGEDGKGDWQSPALDSVGSDLRNALRPKINSGGEHLRSQWQPKYQDHPRNLGRENRGYGGGRRFATQGTQFHKESQPRPIENYSLPFEEPNSSRTQGKHEAEWQNTGHQDNNRGKKVIADQAKELIHFAAKKLLTDAEVAPENSNSQQEPPMSLAQRRQGHYNNRFNRGPRDGNFGGGRDLVQDAGQQIPDMNEDKWQKGGSHLDYDSGGTYNRGRFSVRQNPVTAEETQEGSSQTPGLRYKDRGPSYSRRGGRFYGQRAFAAVQTGEFGE